MQIMVAALVLAAALAGGNYVVVGPTVAGCPPCTAILFGGPFLLAVAIAGLVRVVAKPEAVASSAAPATPVEPPENTALRFLGALQEEGRLVDFFTEDVAAYSDEQIGAATRAIHANCAQALRAAVALEPIMAGSEGDTVTVPAGFDAAAIRLVGNVAGEPPFTGMLRHPGWRARSMHVPQRGGHDPHVIAPAEVEIA